MLPRSRSGLLITSSSLLDLGRALLGLFFCAARFEAALRCDQFGNAAHEVSGTHVRSTALSPATCPKVRATSTECRPTKMLALANVGWIEHCPAICQRPPRQIPQSVRPARTTPDQDVCSRKRQVVSTLPCNVRETLRGGRASCRCLTQKQPSEDRATIKRSISPAAPRPPKGRSLSFRHALDLDPPGIAVGRAGDAEPHLPIRKDRPLLPPHPPRQTDNRYSRRLRPAGAPSNRRASRHRAARRTVTPRSPRPAPSPPRRTRARPI